MVGVEILSGRRELNFFPAVLDFAAVAPLGGSSGIKSKNLGKPKLIKSCSVAIIPASQPCSQPAWLSFRDHVLCNAIEGIFGVASVLLSSMYVIPARKARNAAR